MLPGSQQESSAEKAVPCPGALQPDTCQVGTTTRKKVTSEHLNSLLAFLPL